MHGGGGLSDTGVLLVCMVDKENEGGEREGEMKVWWLCKVLQATYRTGSIKMRASSKSNHTCILRFGNARGPLPKHGRRGIGT